MQITDIKPAIAARTVVTHNGIDYYITGCIMRLRDGEWKYTVELRGLKANSVTIAKIENVILKENV